MTSKKQRSQALCLSASTTQLNLLRDGERRWLGLVNTLACWKVNSLRVISCKVQHLLSRGECTCRSLPAESQQDIVADLLFDHEVGLGMEIIRFNFGASSTAASAINRMRPFGAVPCVLLQNGTYDWTLVWSCSACLRVMSVARCFRKMTIYCYSAHVQPCDILFVTECMPAGLKAGISNVCCKGQRSSDL